MIPMLIEAKPRRIRLKLWMTLLLPILAAIPILIAAGIHPFPPDPAAAAIEGLKAWAADGTEPQCFDNQEYDQPPRFPDNGPVNCLVKMAYVARGEAGLPIQFDKTRYFAREATITQRGCSENNADDSFARRGDSRSLEPAELTRARELVGKLPASDWWVRPTRMLVVGFLDKKGSWVVRTYDRTAPPAVVAELVRLSKLGPWGGQND